MLTRGEDYVVTVGVKPVAERQAGANGELNIPVTPAHAPPPAAGGSSRLPGGSRVIDRWLSYQRGTCLRDRQRPPPRRVRCLAWSDITAGSPERKHTVCDVAYSATGDGLSST